MNCRHIFTDFAVIHEQILATHLTLMRSECLSEESKGVQPVAVQNAERVDVDQVDVNPRLDFVFFPRSHDLTPRTQTLQ